MLNRFKFSSSPAITMWVMVFVVTLIAMETDIFVPSFPAIQAFFGATENQVQMIVSINFLGLSLASLAFGPLSDAYGRRRILLAGLGIFAVSGVGTLFAQSLESLLFWRFFQGIGSAAAFVIPGAVIYDIYSKEDAAKALGLYNSVITLAIAGAPILGSALNVYFGWKANFILVAVLAWIAFAVVFVLVKETLEPSARRELSVKNIGSGYAQLLSNRYSVSNLLVISLLFAGYLVYISNLSLIFINHLRVDETIYALYQAATLLTFAGVSIWAAKIIDYFGMNKTRLMGKIVSFIGAIGLLVVAWFNPTNPVLITIAMCVFTAGFAAMITVVFSDFMSEFPDIKGIASALCSALRLFFVAIVIDVSGRLFDGSIMPVAWIIFVFSAFATFLYFGVLHKRSNSLAN